MKNQKLTIDTIDSLSIAIESANNLILCYEDLCDNSNDIILQLPRYRSLLFTAGNILNSAIKTLETTSVEMAKMEV